MSNILDSYIKAIERKYGISENEAFEVLSAVLMLDKPYDEVYQNIWIGGQDDCGFDAVYIDDQTNDLFLFQSKNSPKLTQGQLMKLDTDFKDLFELNNRSGKKINSKLQARIDEYQDFTRKGIALTPKLFFVYSGKNDDPENSFNETLSSEFSGRASSPEYTVFDSVDLIKRLSVFQRTRRDDIEFTFRPLETDISTISQQAMFSFVTRQVTGASFRIKATHLCELMDMEVKTNGSVDTLFSENVRGYLGKNKANKSIDNTLRDPTKAPFFLFMNNGLTIICESMVVPIGPQAGEYLVSVVNPVIVNGLQTSHVLYDIFSENPEWLDNVDVIVRVYENRNKELTELITEATNTQTSINFKDQMSNKKFNEIAHDYFAARGVKYVSKRGESVRDDDLAEGIQNSINNETVLKFWFATYNRNPRLAKSSKKSVLESIFLAAKGENPVLSDLFNGSPDSLLYAQLFCSYEIYTLVVEQRKEKGDTPGMEYLLHADELISYAVFLDIEKEGLLDSHNHTDLEKAYDRVLPQIEKIVEGEKKRRGEAYSHSKYFKSEASFEDYNALT